MRDNPLQFGAVREDPRLERAVLQKYGGERLLVIASGGCTTLALSGWYPDAQIHAVDANPAQLQHLDEKRTALRANADLATHTALAERGNFESLFALFRSVVHEFVLTPSELEEFFVGGDRAILGPIHASPYWPVAFELAFSDTLVTTMFGPDAVQHAEPGSYPRYFQAAVEHGLFRDDATENPFLHHILCGRYFEHAPPDYVVGSAHDNISVEQALIEEIDFGRFDYIGLSNVMDWMAPQQVRALLQRIDSEARPGTSVLWRQLNNNRPLYELLGNFQHDHELGLSLRAQDRSLFYGRIHVCHYH